MTKFIKNQRPSKALKIGTKWIEEAKESIDQWVCDIEDPIDENQYGCSNEKYWGLFIDDHKEYEDYYDILFGYLDEKVTDSSFFIWAWDLTWNYQEQQENPNTVNVKSIRYFAEKAGYDYKEFKWLAKGGYDERKKYEKKFGYE